MLQKIDFLLPEISQYQVLHHFTTKLYEAFRRQGAISCRLLGGMDRINVPMQDPPDLTIAFNGTLRMSNDKLLCDVIKVPHLACLVDPPYRFYHLLQSPYMILGCDDRFFCNTLKSNNFPRTLFVPHAVEPEIAFKSDQERIYDVSMLATFIDYQFLQKSWKKRFAPFLCSLMNKTIEVTFSEQNTSFLQVFDQILDTNKSNLSAETYAKILQELEMVIKGKERCDLIRSLKDMTIHVFGSTVSKKGWQDFLNQENLHHVTWHEGVPYLTALEIMQKSRIILNSSLKNKEGAHERIFASLACGAIVVTSENDYLKETFREDEGILFYKHAEIEKVNGALHTYLSDETKRSRDAAIGRDIVLKHHTWDQRVKDLLRELPAIIKQMQ